MLVRAMLAAAAILLIAHGARADEAMARAIGFPKGFDPMRDAARQEAKQHGGNAAKIERDAKRWRAQQAGVAVGAAQAAPSDAALALRQRIAMNNVAKRRAMLARGYALYASRNAAMAMHGQAAINRSLGRW